MKPERVVLELGEETTLSPGETKDGHRFHVVGGAAIADSSEEDITEATSLRLVGAQVGRTRVSYGPDLAETLTPEEKFAGRGATSSSHQVWEIEVVEKKERANDNAAPGGSSIQFNGLLPMTETQEGPSEKTPYGMDQENKPVAPHPSMAAGSDATVARASEDAEATGPVAPETSEQSDSKAATSKKGSKSKA